MDKELFKFAFERNITPPVPFPLKSVIPLEQQQSKFNTFLHDHIPTTFALAGATVLVTTSKALVTTSDALVTTSVALVSTSLLLLLVRHLLLVAWHLFLVASCPSKNQGLRLAKETKRRGHCQEIIAVHPGVPRRYVCLSR